MRLTLLIISILTTSFLSFSQTQSPKEFLGYELGSKFSRHHQVISYFEYVARQNPKQVKLIPYGQTNEGRPLMIAVIGSEEKMTQIEDIRQNNLKSIGVLAGQATGKQPAIVWLSYNVHGNEPTSSEASLQVLYDLIDSKNALSKQVLSNCIVILDPCINPDGRDRYVNWYNQKLGSIPDANPSATEHYEPWPQGRYNHYCFDLNRDWAWQVQVESQQRIPLYNQWMPHIHVDFHEQGYNSPYYFAPASKPFHEEITTWQKDFQTTIGKYNAKRFDANNWLYVTKERFDLFYPSYGDTYPTYNGAIGMTYEQGGIRAGLAMKLSDGDTLTLKQRVSHHVSTSWGTMEAATENADKITTEFVKFFDKAKNNPSSPYKSYVFKAKGNESKLRLFTEYLDKNSFNYGIAGKEMLANGYSFLDEKNVGFKIEAEDVVVNMYQPRSTLLRILLEPKSMLEDSATYDITAWSLPYAYGLNAFGVKDRINPVAKVAVNQTVSTIDKPYAYLVRWGSFTDVKFLSALLKKGIKVRSTEKSFDIENQTYQPGTLVITRTGNEKLGVKFDEIVKETAQKLQVSLTPITSGLVSKGGDLGSESIFYIQAPKIAILGGEGTASTNFGELWHFFDKQIEYPVTVLGTEYFNNVELKNYNTLIIPNGSFSKTLGDKGVENIRTFVKNGGKLILMQGAVDYFSGKTDFDITHKEEKKDEKKENITRFEDREREAISEDTPGSIYKISMDNSHPLGFGYDKTFFGLILEVSDYKSLKSGWNVGTIKENGLVAGFAGKNAQEKLKNSLIFGTQELGKGQVIYLVCNPLFRGFWQNGKLLFGNAVFMN